MERTIKNFLKTALLPIGKVLYVYGGGWNLEDKAAGTETKTIGLSPKWQQFYFENAKEGYNYKNFDYKKRPELIHSGLDCSGFTGWVLYNLFNDKNGGEGFVLKSTEICKNLAKAGLGSLRASSEITELHAGDIMGGEKAEHIFICIGSCPDGSLVLVHSSPPAPMLSGTRSPAGEKTEAVFLAEKYMKKAYPRHFALFPKVSRPYSYLTGFGRFRFYDNIVSDPEGFGNLSAEAVLMNLFS